MPIVLITESLLLKSSARDGRVLRDRMLSGFCVRMNARNRTFRVCKPSIGVSLRNGFVEKMGCFFIGVKP